MKKEGKERQNLMGQLVLSWKQDSAFQDGKKKRIS